MRKRSQVTARDDGTIMVTSLVPTAIWGVVCKHADRHALKPIQSWGLMLSEITSRIEAGNTDLFGPTFEATIQDMQLNNELGRSNLPPIDYSKLHRDHRLKSGFAGVYANGQAFRAVGPGQKYIGQFPSAELAAWAKHIWHIKNGLPYGDAEDRQTDLLKEIEKHRKRHSGFGKISDRDLVKIVDDDNRLGGLPSLTQQILDAGLVFGGVDGSKEQALVYGDDGRDETSVVPTPLIDKTTPKQREAHEKFMRDLK